MTSVHTLFCHTKAVDLNATVTLGICSHSVAVAELNKNLYEFVTSFKMSNRKPGFLELAVQQAPEERITSTTQSQPVTKQMDRTSSSISNWSLVVEMQILAVN